MVDSKSRVLLLGVFPGESTAVTWRRLPRFLVAQYSLLPFQSDSFGSVRLGHPEGVIDDLVIGVIGKPRHRYVGGFYGIMTHAVDSRYIRAFCLDRLNVSSNIHTYF